MKKSVVIILFCGILLYTNYALAFEAKVIGVTDGDTVTVLDESKRSIKIRLYGIDCPEKNQDFGMKAKQFVSDRIFGQTVWVDAVTQDRYGRTVGIIKYGDQTINRDIVTAGYAWVYTRYCSKVFCPDWMQLQEQAKAAKIGLWSYADPIPPWNYRNGTRTGKSSTSVASSSGSVFHGNTKSHKFHKISCRYFNCKNCTRVFKSREAAINAGFSPCGICKP